MYHQSTAEFGLKPCSLWRHDVARISNVHDLLHGDGIKCQGCLHLTTVHTAFQFAKTTKSTHKVNALVATQVLDTKNFVKNQLRRNAHIQHANGIILRRMYQALPSASTTPLPDTMRTHATPVHDTLQHLSSPPQSSSPTP